VHFLLGLALFRRFRAPDPTLMANRSSRLRAKNLAGAAVLIAAAIAVLRINFGAPYAFRPIMAESWLYKPEVTIDPALPVLNATGPELVVNDIRTTNLPSGAHYATRLQISNDMLPPRYVSGIKGIPDPIAEPQSVQYFYAYIPGGYTLFGARFSGTETVAPVKERSTVWAQIRIDARTVWQGQETYWILVEKIIPTP
jgi:hypothetical protein